MTIAQMVTRLCIANARAMGNREGEQFVLFIITKGSSQEAEEFSKKQLRINSIKVRL